MAIAVVENIVWQNAWRSSFIVLNTASAYNAATDAPRARHAQYFIGQDVAVVTKSWQLTNQGNTGFFNDVQRALNAKWFDAPAVWVNEYKPSPRLTTDFIQSSDIFASHDTSGWPEYPYPPFWVNENRGTFNVTQSFNTYLFQNDVWLLKKQDKFTAPEQVVWNPQPILPQSVKQTYIPYVDSFQQPSAKWFDPAAVFTDFSQRFTFAAINFAAYNPATDIIFRRPSDKFFQEPQVIWGPQPITANVFNFFPGAYNPAIDPIFRIKQARFDNVESPVYDKPQLPSRWVWDVQGIIPPPPSFLTVVLNWGGRVVLSPKKIGESVFVPVDFISRLAFNETILTATCNCTVYTGIDPTPSAMLIGPASVNGTVVEQEVGHGVVGTIYELLYTITTSLGQTLQLSGYFTVEPDLP